MGVTRFRAPQAWQTTLNLAVLSNLFNLYPSKGNVTIATPTNLPSALDGPIQVARYGALTVNAALSVGYRCRGLFLLCDSLSIGAAGSISMTARGAAGCSKWAAQDIKLPSNVQLSGLDTSCRAFLAWLAANGYAIFDPTLYACPLPGQGDTQANYAAWLGNAIVSATGCGASTPGNYSTGTTNGNAGTKGPGAGGAGASDNHSLATGAGNVWGGGAGSGGGGDSGSIPPATAPDQYGGVGGAGWLAAQSGSQSSGGGAGNPGGAAAIGSGTATDGGSGTGGVLVILCRGNVSLTAGHVLSANGVAGGAYGCGGGGSGGGFVGLYYGGTLTGTPNLTAAGGPGGATVYSHAGAGGAGATVVATLASMGWS